MELEDGEDKVKNGMHVKVDVHSSQSAIASIEKASQHHIRVEKGETTNDVVVRFDSIGDETTFNVFQVMIVLVDPFTPQLLFEAAVCSS